MWYDSRNWQWLNFTDLRFSFVDLCDFVVNGLAN
jgi:hypothetical protein